MEFSVSAEGSSHRRNHRGHHRFDRRQQGVVMLIARVIGEVVSTQKHASHKGRKALLVQPLNLDGTNRGDAVIALDSVDAGAGDRVLLATEGFSARPSGGRPQSPMAMPVVGFVASIDLSGV